MTRSIIALSAAVLILLVNGAAQAQQKPDFTGTWTMDMSRSESAAQGTDVSPRTPVKLILRQSPAAVTVETDRDGSRERLQFVFGQSELPTGTSGRKDADVEPAGVEWRGGDLVTTTVYRVNRMPVKQVRTLRLAQNGREMIVETRVEMQHGYESDHPDYKSGTMVTDVYTKSDH
jgi:hypothetical protein